MKFKFAFILGLLALLPSSTFVSAFRRSPLRVYNHQQLKLIPELHQVFSQTGINVNGLASQVQQSLLLAEEAVSMYSKVDKTGFIGFFATYIEEAIDLGRSVVGSYGVSIILFTVLGKKSLYVCVFLFLNVIAFPIHCYSKNTDFASHNCATGINHKDPKVSSFAKADPREVCR